MSKRQCTGIQFGTGTICAYRQECGHYTTDYRGLRGPDDVGPSCNDFVSKEELAEMALEKVHLVKQFYCTCGSKTFTVWREECGHINVLCESCGFATSIDALDEARDSDD